MENVQVEEVKVENAPMMTLDAIKDKLQDRKLYVVSDATGLSYPTLKKLHDGESTNFTLDTIQRVSNYFGEDANTNK